MLTGFDMVRRPYSLILGKNSVGGEIIRITKMSSLIAQIRLEMIQMMS